MNLKQMNPWNWFKHEESGSQIPVKRAANDKNLPASEANAANPLWQFHQEIDRLFDDAFRNFGFRSPLLESSPLWGQKGFRPSLNVASDDKNYHISLEIPGMTESDISIEIEGDVLTIQGQKQEEKENKEREYYRIERSYGSFQRTLALPEDADAESIGAKLKDGLLELTIPRKAVPERKTKKIAVG